MIEVISNGSKWCGEEPDTIEDLLKVMETETLDSTFEEYGNFIDNNPQWLKSEIAEKYKGCTKFFGNFLTASHVFNIITDDENIIELLTNAVNRNKNTKEYKESNKERLQIEENKKLARKKFENGKISQKEIYESWN